MTASVAAALGTAAAAVTVPLAVPGGVHPGSAVSPPTPGVHLLSPVRFRQVAHITGPCRPGWHGLPGSPRPGSAPTACFFLTRTGMTVTGIESARVGKSPLGGYYLVLHLGRADGRRLAALTSKLAGQPSPRCQLAIIVGGVVVAHPVVEPPVTSGTVQIAGLASRAQAEGLSRGLLSR